MNNHWEEAESKSKCHNKSLHKLYISLSIALIIIIIIIINNNNNNNNNNNDNNNNNNNNNNIIIIIIIIIIILDKNFNNYNINMLLRH